MSVDSFVHLHLHTHYSTLDGAIQAEPLMKRAKKLGMPAVAMTDHGNMFGAIEFYRAAHKAGIKPIIGCEVYVAPGSRLQKSAGSARDAASHFTLLAENAEGYQNLAKLVTAGFLEGYYYKPRVDKELLAKHAKGLIALSGCLKAEVNQFLTQNQPDKAKATMAELRDIFGADNLFVELHDHGLEMQRKNNPQLVGLAKEFGLGLVAANDVHFLERAHHDAHDVLVCIGTGASVQDQKRMHYSPELYFKSPEEMRLLFQDFPGACDNTLRIAERCNLEIEFGRTRYPDFEPPAGKTREAFLRELCDKGLRDRYGERAQTDETLRQRLNYELSVLEKSGFTSYFLIVWDFIRFARERGIPVGPGRGSAAGSIAAYTLGITDIDPIRFNLLFERFLNPERVSPPDIDVDFCQNRRSEVIDYVRQKYGESRVSQIITYGTLSSKAVLKDVNRALGFSFAEGDRLSKLIPLKGQIPHDLVDAIKVNPELKQLVESDANARQVWDYALVLEGLVRNTGVHAAGVVIGGEDLSNIVPLARDKEGQIITQFDGNTLNDLGLLKMDFLGLKTLTLIEDALTLIRQRGRDDFDIKTIPYDDPPTLAMLNRGETVGVFQLESGGMTNLCKQFDVHSIDDIIALIALFRPGPMDLIPDYIARKRGKTKVRFAHPLLEGSLRRHLRRHDLPGAGHGGRQSARGLHAGRRRFAAPRDGQEGPREDEARAQQIRGRLRDEEQHRGGQGERHFRLAREVRRLRLQPEPQRRLRLGQLPDRLPEGEFPGRVHVGRAQQRDQRERRHGKDRHLRRGVPAHGHRHSAARCESQRPEVPARGHAEGPRHSLRHGGGEKRRRRRGRSRPRGAHRQRTLPLAR